MNCDWGYNRKNCSPKFNYYHFTNNLNSEMFVNKICETCGVRLGFDKLSYRIIKISEKTYNNYKNLETLK
jgi:hypothetical protein